ncbi:MAG: glutamate-5-semialdehyde dehydrogenase [Oscillospiraceae bacterium]|nr:glutamate-5-semialdehyde dehydrogenase [Oscillospiraceae bacterium]
MAMQELLTRARSAKAAVASLSTQQKNAALAAMAQSLLDEQDAILAANRQDLKKARGTVSDVMLDRLALSPQRIADMAKGILEVAALPDPVGLLLDSHTRSDGLLIEKISVPMGVIAIIYESRPNVTSDAAALALKAGSVCILRGGKEAFSSARAIVDALRRGLKKAGVTENAINLVTDPSRDSAAALMKANGYVDLLIPRGGAGLINACVQNATVPCIATGTGICHIYVEQSADLSMALSVLYNAKTSRPSVCNAAEVLLVDRAIAPLFLPMVRQALVDDRKAEGLIPVQLRLDETASSIIEGVPAGTQDFDTEFLDYTLAIRVVDGIEEAISHIAEHSTGHSEAILTQTEEAKRRFTSAVDSAAVYVNASTRFTDGGQFGLGCEMGISTQKLHARGPMGLRELTSYKYIITGNGNIR